MRVKSDNFKMKLFVLFLLIIIFNSAFATDTVKVLNNDSSFAVYGTTNNTFQLYADSSSASDTTETAPAKIYIPMEISGTTNRDYYYTNTSGTTNDLFKYGSSSGSSTTYSADVVKFPLKITVGSTAKYVYIAIKLSSGYKAISRSSSAYSNETDSTLYYSFSPQKICEAVASETTNCSQYDLDGTPVENTRSFTVYFFLSDSSTLVNSTTPPDTYTGGSYFQTNYSNRTYTASELYATLSNLRKGDKRVVGDFTNSATMEDFKKTGIFIHSGAACATNSILSACTGSFSSDYSGTSQSSSFTLANLTNSVAVTVSVAFIDKYGFSSVVSNSASQTPTQIEELLKKQNCFLLTAGFGEEHFVIDYFRHFRDHTLQNYYFGRVFIKNYYKYAPSFALSIYNNEIIRFLIRTGAFGLYYLFNYFSWVIVIFVFLLGILFSLKKQKKFS